MTTPGSNLCQILSGWANNWQYVTTNSGAFIQVRFIVTWHCLSETGKAQVCTGFIYWDIEELSRMQWQVRGCMQTSQIRHYLFC